MTAIIRAQFASESSANEEVRKDLVPKSNDTFYGMINSPFVQAGPATYACSAGDDEQIIAAMERLVHTAKLHFASLTFLSVTLAKQMESEEASSSG